ncbi:hypothetical protein [Clostridium sp.]
MAYTSVYENIIFIEGQNESAKIVGNINSDLSFKFGAQLKNLNDVKKELVNKAKKLGANCVLNFTYGQKSRLFAIDDVAFYGAGKAAILPNEIFLEITNKIKRR